MRKPLCCQNCGCDHDRKPGAGLHCKPECKAAYEAAQRDAVANLESLGFVQSDIPNMFRKDGFAVTIEQVINEGIDKTLARHEAAVSYSRG